MAFEIKGVNNLLKRLNKLSSIETKEVVREVAKDMEEAIKEKASTFSNNADEIKAFKPRTYSNGSSYIDVGLKSSESDWDKIKGLYFNNYGYHPRGGATLIDSHEMWFDEAVQGAENEVKAKLKAKLKQQIKECWNG